MSDAWALNLMRAAGGIQLAIAIGSLTIPKILNWPAELSRLSPLLRRLFWVYAGYILGFNLLFGSLCLFGGGWLLEPTPTAVCLLGGMALYWGARVTVQFTLFPRAVRPQGGWYDVGDWALTAAFSFLTLWFLYSGLRLLSGGGWG